MIADPFAALLLPVQTGDVPFPEGGSCAFLGARFDPALLPWRERLLCEQGFRPGFHALAAAGFQAAPRIAGGGFDLVLCLLSKHKKVALADVARGLSLLKPGGALICAGRADAGAAAVAKAAKAAVGPLAEASKRHARVFWLRRAAGDVSAICREWLADAAPRRVETIDAVSVPGVFGWDRIDPGSRLLAECLDRRIGGRVADFGAGWGFLSREILARCPEVRALDLVEAEFAALDAARRNVAASPGVDLAFRWHDVLSEPGLGPYDWVVSNPPFHDGKDGDPEIGRGFIRAARAALAPGGRLLLVANRHLPYETAIDAAFKGRATVAETRAFKVIEARA